MGKQDRADAAVIGAGVFGLAIAWRLARTGRRVVVLEAEAPGAGASGGPVGALVPHAPEPWTSRKAFQRDALLAAPADWAAVAADSGRDPGYARLGRLIPLETPAARARADRLAVAAARHWPGEARWEVRDAAPGRWPAAAAAPHGVVHETLAARVAPARALAALEAALLRHGGRVERRWPVHGIEAEGVAGPGGRTLAAPVVVVAAGTGSDALLAPFVARRLLRGVKGQALLLRVATPRPAPIVAGAGLYIVPQPGGHVAVGATSEPDWTAPRATDVALDALLSRACALCPDLDGGAVVARWAGVRPRGLTADPVVGPVPGRPGLFVATGGYKLGFALAHAVARGLAAMLDDRPHGLPDVFGTTALVESSSGPRRVQA